MNLEIRIQTNVETENDFKIITSNFYSRHSNNVEYVTVLKYIPETVFLKLICSCLSGARTCWCCSHVASLIYYLSYARYLLESLKKPGISLDNLLVCLKKDEFSEDEIDKTDEIDEIDAESYEKNETLLEALDSESINDNLNDVNDLNVLSQIIDLKKKPELGIKRELSVSSQLSVVPKKKNVKVKSPPIVHTNQSTDLTCSSQTIKSSQLKNKYSYVLNQ